MQHVFTDEELAARDHETAVRTLRDAVQEDDWLAARLDRERRDVAERIAEELDYRATAVPEAEAAYRVAARIAREEADRDC